MRCPWAWTVTKPVEAIVDWFRKNNLLEEVRPYRHAVGHSVIVATCPSSRTYTDQWYVKVTDDRLANAALRALADDQVTRHSEHESKRAKQGKAWEGKLTVHTRSLRQDVPDLAREYPRLVY